MTGRYTRCPTHDQALIAALRDAGHDGAANHVRDRSLADDLRTAGHHQLADALTAKAAGTAQPATEPGNAQP